MTLFSQTAKALSALCLAATLTACGGGNSSFGSSDRPVGGSPTQPSGQATPLNVVGNTPSNNIATVTAGGDPFVVQGGLPTDLSVGSVTVFIATGPINGPSASIAQFGTLVTQISQFGCGGNSGTCGPTRTFELPCLFNTDNRVFCLGDVRFPAVEITSALSGNATTLHLVVRSTFGNRNLWQSVPVRFQY